MQLKPYHSDFSIKNPTYFRYFNIFFIINLAIVVWK